MALVLAMHLLKKSATTLAHLLRRPVFSSSNSSPVFLLAFERFQSFFRRVEQDKIEYRCLKPAASRFLEIFDPLFCPPSQDFV